MPAIFLISDAAREIILYRAKKSTACLKKKEKSGVVGALHGKLMHYTVDGRPMVVEILGGLV